MIPLIEEKRAEIEALCRKYHVRTLELFGSAATGEFDPATSDVDFLVIFQDGAPAEHKNDYFGLLFALEELLGRKVDLVMTRAIRNPYFLRAIAPDRLVLYAA
jgi:predicted nucleotidyltransferase